MMDIEEKLEKYRKNIARKEVTDALKCFYETRDMKVRENLIYRYMPAVKEHILKYRKVVGEEEDLIQTAYEILIDSIDNYNPYKNAAFSTYLHVKIRNKMENQNIIETISLTNMEIISNANLEDMIISDISKKNIINTINYLLSADRAKKSVDIFRRLYGINCKLQNPKEISESLEVNKQFVSRTKIKMLISLYLFLIKRYNCYPSQLLEEILKTSSISYVCGLTNKQRKEIEKLDLKELDYLEFCDSYDCLQDSHKVLKRK